MKNKRLFGYIAVFLVMTLFYETIFSHFPISFNSVGIFLYTFSDLIIGFLFSVIGFVLAIALYSKDKRVWKSFFWILPFTLLTVFMTSVGISVILSNPSITVLGMILGDFFGFLWGYYLLTRTLVSFLNGIICLWIVEKFFRRDSI